jgi:hypothetical protein
MAIKRYFATLDNTITNAYKNDMSTKGTGSNMGASDILEVFSIYGQQDSASSELSRVLIKFPIDQIQTDRTASTIPASGSVDFYLRLFNAKHSQTLPKNYDLIVAAVEKSWSEGTGLDMEGYTDIDQSNWIKSDSSTSWTNEGGDYRYGAGYSFSSSLDTGTEDLEVNISALVERWANDTSNTLDAIPNYGVGIFLTPSEEAADRSYYTKKFFARGTEFFFRKPCIEARWNSSETDDRANFYYSSSLAPASENVNTLYLYNYVRGRLRDIPGLDKTGGKIYVSIYSGSGDNMSPSISSLNLSKGGGIVASLDFNVTGGKISTGIYTASVVITASQSPPTKLFDVWHDGTGPAGGLKAVQYQTGSITPNEIYTSFTNPSEKYATNITNLRSSYSRDETARFRVFIRSKDWNPTIYSKATQEVQPSIIESASYSIHRIVDDFVVIPHGTSSTGDPGRGSVETLHTMMSYDVSGNYFDFDMGLLEDGYSYGISTAYYNGSIGSWVNQPETFKFRIESRQKK